MKVVSFFAGCGGLDLGFEQAGFDVVWANEFEPHCRASRGKASAYFECEKKILAQKCRRVDKVDKELKYRKVKL